MKKYILLFSSLFVCSLASAMNDTNTGCEYMENKKYALLQKYTKIHEERTEQGLPVIDGYSYGPNGSINNTFKKQLIKLLEKISGNPNVKITAISPKFLEQIESGQILALIK